MRSTVSGVNGDGLKKNRRRGENSPDDPGPETRQRSDAGFAKALGGQDAREHEGQHPEENTDWRIQGAKGSIWPIVIVDNEHTLSNAQQKTCSQAIIERDFSNRWSLWREWLRHGKCSFFEFCGCRQSTQLVGHAEKRYFVDIEVFLVEEDRSAGMAGEDHSAETDKKQVVYE